MSAQVESPAVIERTGNREIVTGFSAEGVRAPLILRCGALLLDYLLIIGFPVVFLLIGRFSGNDGARLLSSDWSTVGWLVALLFAATNILVLPVFSGQSIGKIAAGIRIVNLDGNTVSSGRILFRQTVGYLLTVLSAGLGFLLSVFSRNGRALHDYLSGTVVIYAERHIRQ